MTLGITTFLAVNTLGQTFTRGMPKVSYIKAIDVWMISCSTFVFLAIVEFAVAQVNDQLLFGDKISGFHLAKGYCI